MMGTLLSKPNTEKTVQDGVATLTSGYQLQYGACSMQGWRMYQEDTFCISYHTDVNQVREKGRHHRHKQRDTTSYTQTEDLSTAEEITSSPDDSSSTPTASSSPSNQPVVYHRLPSVSHPSTLSSGYYIFSVFDGHGGSSTSQYCQRHFNAFLSNIITEHERREGDRASIGKTELRQAFVAFDRSLPVNNTADIGQQTEQIPEVSNKRARYIDSDDDEDDEQEQEANNEQDSRDIRVRRIPRFSHLASFSPPLDDEEDEQHKHQEGDEADEEDDDDEWSRDNDDGDDEQEEEEEENSSTSSNGVADDAEDSDDDELTRLSKPYKREQQQKKKQRNTKKRKRMNRKTRYKLPMRNSPPVEKDKDDHDAHAGTGSTATVVIIDITCKRIMVCHLGDSRALVFSQPDLSLSTATPSQASQADAPVQPARPGTHKYRTSNPNNPNTFTSIAKFNSDVDTDDEEEEDEEEYLSFLPPHFLARLPKPSATSSSSASSSSAAAASAGGNLCSSATVYYITRDHNPTDDVENRRIRLAIKHDSKVQQRRKQDKKHRVQHKRNAQLLSNNSHGPKRKQKKRKRQGEQDDDDEEDEQSAAQQQRNGELTKAEKLIQEESKTESGASNSDDPDALVDADVQEEDEDQDEEHDDDNEYAALLDSPYSVAGDSYSAGPAASVWSTYSVHDDRVHTKLHNCSLNVCRGFGDWNFKPTDRQQDQQQQQQSIQETQTIDTQEEKQRLKTVADGVVNRLTSEANRGPQRSMSALERIRESNRQPVSAVPDYYELRLDQVFSSKAPDGSSASTLCIVLASDGIWNSVFPASAMSSLGVPRSSDINQQIISWCSQQLTMRSTTTSSGADAAASKGLYSEILGKMFDQLMAKPPVNRGNSGQTDNMTAIVITITIVNKQTDTTTETQTTRKSQHINHGHNVTEEEENNGMDITSRDTSPSAHPVPQATGISEA